MPFSLPSGGQGAENETAGTVETHRSLLKSKECIGPVGESPGREMDEVRKQCVRMAL